MVFRVSNGGFMECSFLSLSLSLDVVVVGGIILSLLIGDCGWQLWLVHFLFEVKFGCALWC